jgi:hypothetical protein
MYLTRTLECDTNTGNASSSSSSSSEGGPITSDASVRGGEGGAGGAAAGTLSLADSVARGCPLSLRLWVPLWLVNGTQVGFRSC